MSRRTLNGANPLIGGVAVLLHGGEGSASAKRYRRLKRKQKDDVAMFLSSLVAPGSPTQPTPGGLGGSGAPLSGGFFSTPVEEPGR